MALPTRLHAVIDGFSYENFKKAVNDPMRAVNHIRNPSPGSIKKYMDMNVERRELPQRIGSLFDEEPDKVRQYQQEIENNEQFYDSFNLKQDKLNQMNELSGSTSVLDAQAAYVVCRILNPDLVVQTGVRYGSFDAHILAAMEQNSNGKMFGIDLPPEMASKTTLGTPEFEYGYLIPDRLKDRWELRLRDAKDELPSLLNEVGPINMFVHDSLHTYEHMFWEYETAFSKVEDGGVIASHDVLGNSVFEDYTRIKDIDSVRVRNFGISVK